MERLKLIKMSSYAKNKLQMCSVTKQQCTRRQMRGYISENWKDFTQQDVHLCKEQTTDVFSHSTSV